MRSLILLFENIVFILLISCVGVFQHAFAQESIPSDSLLQVLIAKEHEMFTIISGDDKAAAEKLFADDYVTINADGVMAGKTETMEAFGKFKGITSKVSERKIRVYDNTAVITGRCKFYMKSILAAEIFYTQIWVFREGQWRFVGWHGTMTGLPSYYPVIVTSVMLLLLYFIARWFMKKVRKLDNGKVAA